MAGNRLLLMGTYRREDARLVMGLQLLDMDNWAGLKQETVEAIYSDIPQVNKQLVETVLAMVKGLDFASGVRLDAPPMPPAACVPAGRMAAAGKFIPPAAHARGRPRALSTGRLRTHVRYLPDAGPVAHQAA